MSVQGKLSPASGLDPADFEVWGTASTSASAVAPDGTFTADCSGWHTGALYALPKDGSATQTRTGADNGLYMSPSLGTSRVVRKGSGYAVATKGDMAIDATTTVMAILLVHPAFAHPSPDVATKEAQWMVDRMKSGWPCLADAATAYDTNLAAGADYSTDAAFAAAIATCVSDALAMPDAEPPVPTDQQLAQVLQQGLKSNPMTEQMGQAGIKVSSVAEESADETSITFKAGTTRGTGLEYRYVVQKLDTSTLDDVATGLLLSEPNPFRRLDDPVVVHTNVTTGYVPSSSYATYLDPVGDVMKVLNYLPRSRRAQWSRRPSRGSRSPSRASTRYGS
ncbi:MAG: hypothetical protein HY906_20230 [Deltaproteobacteria bacterium]|nr:hypothetical protein [Deltaproteobacteria bacterium]